MLFLAGTPQSPAFRPHKGQVLNKSHLVVVDPACSTDARVLITTVSLTGAFLQLFVHFPNIY